MLEAHEGKSLVELLTPFIRQTLLKLNKINQGSELVQEALGVLKSFMKSIHSLRLNLAGVELGIEAISGQADSGDLENDLPDMLLALGNAAKQAEVPIAIMIDELQYLSAKELSALIMSIHKIAQRRLPLLIIGAGLPQIRGLAGNSKSYAERLFTYPEIGALTDAAAVSAIRNPAHKMGVSYTDDAVAALLKETEKYPYFIQQWAYEAWNIADTNKINLADINKATPQAIRELDQSFFRVRFDRCTPSEKRYMRALAKLGEGRHRSSNIAAQLNVKSQSVAPVRSSLIKKGMVYSPTYGDTAFTVPRFHDFMQRIMDLEL